MSTVEKATIITMVETLDRRKRQALMALGIPKSSYYRWLSVAPGATRFGKPEKAVEPDHS